jgi:hypothetical protein
MMTASDQIDMTKSTATTAFAAGPILCQRSMGEKPTVCPESWKRYMPRAA